MDSRTRRISSNNKYNDIDYHRYVEKICNKYGQAHEYDDLYQVCHIALWTAEQRYDPETGPFHHYALVCMKGELMKWLTDFSRTIRIPANKQRGENKISYIPTISTEISLGDDTTSTIEDLLEADEVEHWDGIELPTYAYDEKVGPLRHYLSELDQDYQDIIMMRLKDNMSFTEIAEIMGTTKQNTNNRYQVGIKKLQEAFGLAPVGTKNGWISNKERAPSKLIGRPSPNKGKKYNKDK